jgi:hypothetical protein
MSEGELEKRLGPYCDKLKGEFGAGESGEGFHEEIHNLLDEVRKEFPSTNQLAEAIRMAEATLDFKAHGFSYRWVLRILKETLKARQKWFGSAEKK